jgi:cytolysin-activating lysine-acyltransferase
VFGLDSPPFDRDRLRRVEFVEPLSERDQTLVGSGVLYLCQHSDLHASYPAQMLERRIAPSLALGQFRYYTDSDGVPLAFCNWAWLSAPVLEEILATCRDLEPAEFNCGDLPIFYEFLAPFGHCRAAARDLRGLPFFGGKRVPSIRVKVDESANCTAQLRIIAM